MKMSYIQEGQLLQLHVVYQNVFFAGRTALAAGGLSKCCICRKDSFSSTWFIKMSSLQDGQL
jgi:hypothetical protein